MWALALEYGAQVRHTRLANLIRRELRRHTDSADVQGEGEGGVVSHLGEGEVANGIRSFACVFVSLFGRGGGQSR